MKALRKCFVVGLIFVLALVALPAGAQEYDLGGKTVTFIGWVDNLEDAEKEGRIAEAEELFNVKIAREIIDQENYQEILMSRLISGDSEYDVWRMASQPPWFLSLAAQDALLSVTKTVGNEYYQDAFELAGAGLKTFSLGEDYYAVGLFPLLADGGTSDWMLFNKDIIEEAGLPSPYELYFAGEWDWDAMREIAIATTIDFDGDGTIDQWGIANMYEFAYLTITNGDNIYIEDEHGRMKYNWTSDGILEGLAMGNQLRMVDKVVTNGFAPFEQGNAALSYAAGWQIDVVKELGINYGIVPLPKGPRGENTLYTGWIETFVIPSNVDQPEAMIALVDFLTREDDLAGAIERLIETRVNQWAPDRDAARIVEETLTKYSEEGELLHWSLVNADVADAYREAILGEKTPAEATLAFSC